MPRVVCSIACLPHERHVSGKRVAGTPIVDTNRVSPGHLDFRVVAQVDVHDVGSRCRSESLGDGRGVRRFHPLQRGESKAVTFSFLIWAYSVFCNDLMKKDRALLRGQIFFNPVDQLGNIDWLGERWTPLDVEASLCLRFRD